MAGPAIAPDVASQALHWISGARGWVEIGCVVVMFVAPVLAIIFAVKMKRPYFGEGLIRFVALAEIVPAIVILGLEQVLGKAAAGTILAGVAGYVLGGLGDGGGGGKRRGGSDNGPSDPGGKNGTTKNKNKGGGSGNGEDMGHQTKAKENPGTGSGTGADEMNRTIEAELPVGAGAVMAENSAAGSQARKPRPRHYEM